MTDYLSIAVLEELFKKMLLYHNLSFMKMWPEAIWSRIKTIIIKITYEILSLTVIPDQEAKHAPI